MHSQQHFNGAVDQFPVTITFWILRNTDFTNDVPHGNRGQKDTQIITVHLDSFTSKELKQTISIQLVSAISSCPTKIGPISGHPACHSAQGRDQRPRIAGRRRCLLHRFQGPFRFAARAAPRAYFFDGGEGG